MVKVLLLVLAVLYVPQMILADTPEWPSGYSIELIERTETLRASHYLKIYISLEKRSLRMDLNGGENSLIRIYGNGSATDYLYYPITNDEKANVTHCLSYPSRSPFPNILPDITGFSLSSNLTVNGAPAQKWSREWYDSQATFTEDVLLQMCEKTKGSIPIRREEKIYQSEELNKSKLLWHDLLEFYNYEPHEPEKSVWIRPSNVPCVPRETAEWQEYEMGLSTMLSHLDHQRPLRKAKGVKMGNGYPSSASPFPYTDEQISTMASQLPDTFDWRFLGAVTSVKDQLYCGSGWAFGVVGAMEGAYYLKTGFLGEMSEQAMIDCGWWTDPNTGGDMKGCFRGDPRAAFDWIKNHGGLPWTADYGDYKNCNGRCTLNHVKTVGAIKGYVHVKADVDAVKAALYHHGPLTVSIFVPFEFEFYTSGVFKYPGKVGPVNHGVVLIGYGSLNGEDYWLIKNSWGEQWGIAGYGLISANNNTMHFLNHVYYPEMI